MSTSTHRGAPAPDALADQGTERFLAGELAQQIQFLTARARGRGSSHANHMLAPLGIKVRQYSVLSLAASGLKPSQRELGEFLALDPSQIVALVDSLEALGAVQRETDPRDRRSKIIVATDAGLELFGKAREILLESEDVTLGTLSARERKQLRGLLLKIAF
ncbi:MULTISPECIES: MarR family winged helix-turn-helix transcriptional regulator [Micrococcaceae]|uniref:MarR family winged helix-turn-helix transcriptional regulator n=1 Tax=Micrococcaceae TaxID=1268 RepID=UPI00161BC0B8|nr:MULTISPECIES: MarR family winged helix-turn-helix transcriptional regulator [Micrococcaceae]MBB5750225.1 DNA-binding MarR family transcriptional regulator [Micrococcus sp. TA1]HRO29858.1 MarR family winged helix-turn-helix transcriptional regulator [Citricoccus sp.]HRO93760.1 MarR family winged helix-turn-helix transcriptional regulator [Citricoccus sp.]